MLIKKEDDPAPANILGDADLNGKVNIKDATAIQKHLASLSTLSDEACAVSDTDGSGKINVKDATAIQKFVADIETEFPIGSPI